MEQTAAVIYCRVSTEEQAENGTSIVVQLTECQRKAEQMNAKVYQTYCDEGVSGGRYLTRPGIQSALADIEAGRAKVLLATKVDRIGRSAKHVLDIAERVDRAGGRLLTCDGMELGGTPAGKLQLTMFAGVAEWERSCIRERTMSGRRRRAQEGSQPCRAMRPYGYDVVTKEAAKSQANPAGSYVIKEEQALWVREMFARFAAGCSLNKLAQWLSEQAVPTPRQGLYWRKSTLKRILGNPVYKGEPVFGRHRRTSDEDRVTIRSTSEETWVTLTAPPIVDESVWAACQERLRTGRALFGGNPERKNTLVGLLRCRVCGRSMRCNRRKRSRVNGDTYLEHVYFCPDARPSRNPGGVVCNPEYLDAAVAEGAVTWAITEVAKRPELIGAAMAAYEEKLDSQNAEANAASLRSELASLERREQAIARAKVDALIAGQVTDAYDCQLVEVNTRRSIVTARLEEAEKRSGASTRTSLRSAAQTLKQAMVDVYDALHLPQVKPGEKQRLLAKVIESIRPDGNRFIIVLRTLGLTVPIISTL